MLPPDITGNMLRSTECEVFRRLETVLDDSFVVFYSRPWLGLKPDGEEIDGECDFVVAHSELGMLTLEIKGGAIAYDPHTDRWTSQDRWKVTHNIKNPVQQARRAKHELLVKLKVSPYWKSRYIRARHGVVLPHSSAPLGDLGADMPQKILCFEEAFENRFRDWIMDRFGDVPPNEGHVKKFGPDGLNALEKILARPFQLRVPLRAMLYQDDEELEVQTQQQFHILRTIEAVPRAAVNGAAGTGKTVLAMEEARRCADLGVRTLFICYNRGLAMDVRCRLQDIQSVTVMTFHELCTTVTAQAGLSCPVAVPKKQLFEEIWPELLMQAYDVLENNRYGAVVVDEGQDFLPLWWTAVEAGMNPNGPGLLRIFYDDNQRVYARASKLPSDVALIPIRLTKNLRNTRRIHELVRKYYTGHNIEVVGPEGVEITWLKVDSLDRLARHVSDCVERLKSIEGISLDNIGILVDNEARIQEMAPNNRLGKIPAGRCDKQLKGRIIVDTIRRFKGLERQVIIFIATPETVVDEELIYVALSRARTYLIVVGAENEIDYIRGMTRAISD